MRIAPQNVSLINVSAHHSTPVSESLVPKQQLERDLNLDVLWYPQKAKHWYFSGPSNVWIPQSNHPL